jgi:hypothetical protein
LRKIFCRSRRTIRSGHGPVGFQLVEWLFRAHDKLVFKRADMKSRSKMLVLLLVAGSCAAVLADGAPAVSASPTITVNGIMMIGGAPQVLFRVVDNDSPGGRSYSLAEDGQRDGIKIVAIDQQNGTVTFDNHGTVEKIDLQKAVLPAYTPPPPPKPTVSTASFVSTEMTPAAAAKPEAPAEPANLPEEPPAAPEQTRVQSGVTVIGSRPNGSSGYQHFNGLAPMNETPGSSGFAIRRVPPGKMGAQPTQPAPDGVPPTAPISTPVTTSGPATGSTTVPVGTVSAGADVSRSVSAARLGQQSAPKP